MGQHSISVNNGREARRKRALALKRQGWKQRTSAEGQWQMLPELLSHGAEAYGVRGQLWTCARVRAGIGEEFGVWYHKAHVSRLVKALKWTPQLPIERASPRDEAASETRRVAAWPVLKKSRRNMARARE